MKTVKQIVDAHCEKYEKVTGLYVPSWVTLLMEEAADEVASEQREWCAKECDIIRDELAEEDAVNEAMAARLCAAAIRTRGKGE